MQTSPRILMVMVLLEIKKVVSLSCSRPVYISLEEEGPDGQVSYHVVRSAFDRANRSAQPKIDVL